jgi:uncharacterized SAM-binding protein YcdF (DUF218 family)
MFFVVSKILHFLLNPFFWIALLLLFGLFTKNLIKRKRAIVLSFLLLMLFGNRVLVNELALSMEKPWRQSLETTLPDTAVLLGGYCWLDPGLNRIAFSESSDRLLQIMREYQSGKINTLVLSGGSGNLWHRQESEAALTAAYLKEGGFKTSGLLVETQSKNTFENATFTRALLGKSNKSILLVTSAFHMKRALRTFQKAGFEPVPYPTHFLAEPLRNYTLESYLLPAAGAFVKWELILKEKIGYLVYRLKGYC